MSTDPNEREDQDCMEDTTVTMSTPGLPGAMSAMAGLPTSDEPTAVDMATQREDIEKKREELMSMFRYMGTGHPRYAATQAKIDELGTMLKRLELMDS